MERETGFEPATPCLEGRHSTTEFTPAFVNFIVTVTGRGNCFWDVSLDL